MLLFSLFAKTIGIVLPMEHTAMNDILTGFKKSLDPKHKLIVKNAMGDQNLQRSIMQSFKTQGVDFIITVGTSATQMGVSVAKNKIFGISSHAIKGAYTLEDEITSKPMLSLIKEHFPKIKTIALVYSHNEKILPEVEQTKTFCQKLGFNLQLVPVYTTQDLYAVAKHIKADGILILKDHLVVSGIAVLLKLGLPIFASDEGSVKQGALCAIGVSEEDCGIEGAKIVNELLDNKAVSTSSTVKELKLFISKKLGFKSKYPIVILSEAKDPKMALTRSFTTFRMTSEVHYEPST